MTFAIAADNDSKCSRRSSTQLYCLSHRIRNTVISDFGRYELAVLIITQLSYIPVTTTMLSTAFYEPTQPKCASLNVTDDGFRVGPIAEGAELEFSSLLLVWGEACRKSALTALMSTSLMAGALSGSFIAGWLADTHGRLPVIKACLLLICIVNGIFSFVADMSWILSASFLFLLGAACGGYMVTNLVLLVESLNCPGSRLLVVSLNGWSFSMVFVALLARITQHWFLFHMVTSVMAFVACLAFHIWVVESCRWLASVHRYAEARSIALRITSSRIETMGDTSDFHWWEILRFSKPAMSESDGKSTLKKYAYSDLFSHSSVYLPLLALCYCFVSSSIVSFGFYFNTDALPGSRYMNMAFMGISKFVMGLVPFAVSSLVGRRPVMFVSVGVACICAWLAVASQFYGLSSEHWSLMTLSLVVSAALDPAWKINHLYSAELFPTVVRNMARAVCNVAARLGSVFAPLVVHLRTIHYLIPYMAFAAFLTVQLIVVIFCLPETKGQPLPEELPVSEKPVNNRDSQLVELNPSSCND